MSDQSGASSGGAEAGASQWGGTGLPDVCQLHNEPLPGPQASGGRASEKHFSNVVLVKTPELFCEGFCCRGATLGGGLPVITGALEGSSRKHCGNLTYNSLV